MTTPPPPPPPPPVRLPRNTTPPPAVPAPPAPPPPRPRPAAGTTVPHIPTNTTPEAAPTTPTSDSPTNDTTNDTTSDTTINTANTGDSTSDTAVPSRVKPRTKPRSRTTANHTPGSLRLTPRDYQLLTFLARYRLATIGQLARNFHTSEGALRNRLPRLEKAGLLTGSYTAQTKPKVWTLTDTGMKVAALHLTTPQISWGTLRHTLGLVDLGITFEHAGELVLTEREIRAAATRDTPTERMRTALTLLTPTNNDNDDITSGDISTSTNRHLLLPVTGKAWGHIPDMVLIRQPFDNGAPGNIAIELELNRKTTHEWRNILTAYRDTPQYAQTIYYTTDPDVQRPLTTAIDTLNAQHRIHVIPFTPIDTTATP